MSESILTDYDALLRQAVADLAEKADAAGAHGAYRSIDAPAIAYFDPLSPRAGEQALWPRLAELADDLKQRQHDDGLIDLRQSNFHSPPDTAFMVEDLAVLYEVVAGYEPSPRRDELLARLESVIVPGCEAIARGGVHTPNHRWKVASALTLADRIWPHESWRAEAQAYLDEGIDIDADGEFTERSTGCYNYVCDRALVLTGRALGRDDLLECADRNLEHMLHLLHADGTLVTSYSRRQDRHTTVGVERYWLLYWYRAMMTGNGRFLSAAELGLRRLAAAGAGLRAGPKWLRFLAEAGRQRPPTPEPLPQEYETRFDGVGVLRRRRGAVSLTLMADSADLLAVRFGDGPEVIVRVAAGFAPRGQLRAARIEGRDGRYRLRSHHACEYYGPGPDALPAGDWRSRPNFSRRVFVGTELTMTLEVECLPAGLRLGLRTEGCQRVPVEAAFIVRDAQQVAATAEIQEDTETGKHFLNGGELIARGPGRVVTIGPGAAEHDLNELSCGEPYRTRGAYCIRLLTPVETTLTMVSQEA